MDMSEHDRGKLLLGNCEDGVIMCNLWKAGFIGALILLTSCAQTEAPPDDAAPTHAEPVDIVAPPSAAAEMKGKISAYVASSVIRCGTVVAMVALGRDGEQPAEADADDVREMHEALDGFQSAQERLKDFRSAERECIRTASPAYQAMLREAGAALKTELEMINGPEARTPSKTVADIERELTDAKESLVPGDFAGEAVIAHLESELKKAKAKQK